MRCPECEQRNSVASRKCKFCGAKFKRKPLPVGVKVFAVSAFVALLGIIYLVFALPKMVDPAEQLSSSAKRVASGPRSPEDATKAIAEFDQAVKKLLLRYGAESSNLLSSRLKNCLPPAAFEVLVVDLPKGLKLVEIDTVLQASDFLIMRGTSDVKVFPLAGFEVYDDARVVSDQAGSVIVLLGHSGGPPPHRPILQTYALLPDSIVDETANMVPAFTGEGSARFFKDSSDLAVELSAASVAQIEKISMSPPMSPEKFLKFKLQWKDARYLCSAEAPRDSHLAALMIARSLKHADSPVALSVAGAQVAKLSREIVPGSMSETRLERREEKRNSVIYTLTGGQEKIDLEIKKDQSEGWQLLSYKIVALETPAVVSAAKSGETGLSSNTDRNLQPSESNSTSVASTPPPAVSTEVKCPSPSSSPAPLPTEAGTKIALTVSNSNIKPSINPAQTTKSPGQSAVNSTVLDPLAGLRPEIAGSHSPVKNQSGSKAGPEKSAGKTQPDTGSRWLDGEQAAAVKAPVAVSPASPGQPAGKKHSETTQSDTGRKKTKALIFNSTARISGNSGAPSVRMRSGPGLSNSTLDQIPAGAKIQILGEEKGWYRVSYAGKTGYVFSPLVDAKGAAPAASHPERSSGGASPAAPPVSSSAAVVRRAYTLRDAGMKPLATVKVGSRVVVMSGLMKNSRYKVKLPDGSVGYLHKDALDVNVETPPEFVP